MFTIQRMNLDDYTPIWQRWEAFLPSDPTPTNLPIEKVYIAHNALDYEIVKTIGFFDDHALLGGGCIFAKETQGITIGGIGKMAVGPQARRNGIASRLLDMYLTYMFRHGFHISVLWASILELYEKFGYVPLTDNHRETNMMYRPIKGLPLGWTKQRLLTLPTQVGTW